MPRPITPRAIRRSLLRPHLFKPHGVPLTDLKTLELTLDGLEALRLADVEGLYQQEAARRMGISRPTFARILAAARHTVANALVAGAAIQIGGGKVTTRADGPQSCPVHGGPRRRGRGCRCERKDESHR